MKAFAAATAVAVTLVAAGAASAQDVRVAYGDLDLASPAGAQQFDRRVNRAVRIACQGGSLRETAQCAATLRAEIQSLLPSVRREEYTRARAIRQMAMIPVHYG